MKDYSKLISAGLLGYLAYKTFASLSEGFRPREVNIEREKSRIEERRNINLSSVRDVQSGVDLINTQIAPSPAQSIRVKVSGDAATQSRLLNEFVGEFAEEHGGSVAAGASSAEIMATRSANFDAAKAEKDELKADGRLRDFQKLLDRGTAFFNRLDTGSGRSRNDQQRRATSFVRELKKEADNLSGAIRSASRDRRAVLTDSRQLQQETDLRERAVQFENLISSTFSKQLKMRFG